MTKRITIKSGDYVLLSDIPNEQVFNLVKECFVNAGYPFHNCWTNRDGWEITLCEFSWIVYEKRSNFSYKGFDWPQRQLSLLDVFNSTNGKFDWKGFNDCVIFDKSVVFTNSGSAGLYTEDKHIITIKRVIDQNNKTDTYKITKACDINNLQHMGISSVQGSAIGKSTAHHLELISKAMKSPEQWVKVYSDHFDSPLHNTRSLKEVEVLCYSLGLDWIEFSVVVCAIRYMPYQTVKMVTKWERVE